MSTSFFARTYQVIAHPIVRLPANFPFTASASGKLYLKSLLCYIIGSLVPLGLFYGLTDLLVGYAPDFVSQLLDDKNLPLVIAGFTVVTFLSGFGAQLLYVRHQIHKQGQKIRDVIALNRTNFAGSNLKLFAWGLGTFIVAAVLQQSIGAIWPLPIKDPTADMIKSMHGASFAMMIALAVFAPVFEEIIFRGFLFGMIRASLHRRLPAAGSPSYDRKVLLFDLTACFSSALIFAAMHMNLAGLPLYVVTGMVLAEAYRRSGSLYVPIIGHFLNNGIIMLVFVIQH